MFSKIKVYQRVILLVWLGVSAGFAQAATDCNQVTEIPVSECQSLLELYNSTNGANWTDNTGWNQTNTPCSWFGITCDGGYVVVIDFKEGNPFRLGNKLTGQIPDLNLRHLRKLNLSTSQAVDKPSGSIPNFTNLPNLEFLYLSGNQLSGSIPNFSNLPNLQGLYLGDNQLNGSIPNFNLPSLGVLSLRGNQLSGSVPNFTNLPNLKWLELNGNQLSGIIPNFSNLPNLRMLYLGGNQLNGNIPNFVNLPNLQELGLNGNQLNGNIPNFVNLPNLQEISLGGNQLTGRIPNFTSFNLANLKRAEFHNNCGLIAYNAEQESILYQKNPYWKDENINCPVSSYNLMLNKTGNGQISSGRNVMENLTVNLIAVPDADSKFVGWSPSPCATSFQMPANDLTCTATFVLKEKYSLNLTKAEHGTILAEGINCGSDCNESYVENTVVTLNAMPETGYKLESWSGDCVGNSNSCQITMNGNKTVNASFSLIPSYPLTLQTSGDGLGSISGNGNYKVGETVNLTASPDANSVFVDWKPAPCHSSFEMPNNALTCIATFNKKGSTSSTTDLTFFQINPLYNVGEWLHARLKTQLNIASRFNRVDLWVAVQLPDKTMFFMTDLAFRQFSLEPAAFKRSLERMDAEIVVLDFEVPPNMGGDYTFYALYIETGKNPLTDGFTVFRSNIATITTTLRNK